jgi:low affinity Fe/Cu permease
MPFHPTDESLDRARSSRLLHAVDALTTRAGVAVLVALAVIATWVVVAVDDFDEEIQLAFATVCSGITVTMVFVIQHTQRRAQQATQLKLDELIRSLPQADDRVVKVEASSDAELDALEDRVVQHHRAQRAGDDGDTGEEAHAPR